MFSFVRTAKWQSSSWPLEVQVGLPPILCESNSLKGVYRKARPYVGCIGDYIVQGLGSENPKRVHLGDYIGLECKVLKGVYRGLYMRVV